MDIKKLATIFFVLFFIVNTNVLAAELSLPNTIINPDNYLFYSIKRLIEKSTIFLKFTKDSKIDYYHSLINKRAAELKYVVELDLLSEIERATQRFSYQVGILSDYISNTSDLKNRRQSISDFLKSYKGLLENLRDKYPANSSYWMLVQHSINSIDLNLEKLK